MLDGEARCLVPSVLVLRGRRLDRGPHGPSEWRVARPGPHRLDGQVGVASLDGFSTQERHDERRRRIAEIDVLGTDTGVHSGRSPREKSALMDREIR